MKTEKIILSFIGILFGLLVAGGIFYLYQATNSHPHKQTANKNATLIIPTPTTTTDAFPLTLDNQDETIVDKKTIIISGKTNSDITLVISTQNDDQVITPSQQGNFSTTVTINDGENYITIIGIAPNGQEVRKVLTITYSTETF